MPSILQEGLAVYLSGGHFKPEPIKQRAAVMLDLNWYIPLNILADDFYNRQHEICYLEAVAFVQYLYETFVCEKYFEFLTTIPYRDGESESKIIEMALLQVYSRSLKDFEIGFLEYLATQEVIDEIRFDLELTVAEYDLIRRYQLLLDPSPYFLTAWLPDGHAMRDQGIVADFTRHPMSWQNMLIESILVQVNSDLSDNDHDSAAKDIKWTNWLLDFLER